MYCIKCGNTGVDINGDVCECKARAKSFFDVTGCLDVPEQYQGVVFNEALVPNDLHESYAKFLQGVYDKVLVGKWQNRNVLIASPINHSKTILAYSCLQALFREGVPTFPVYDVMELKRIILDLDLCRKSIYDIANPEECMTVPLLFVKIPRLSNWEVYDMVATLLDRRVRRGNSTIFLYDGNWYSLIRGDRNNILEGLVGDGYYTTLEVKSWDVAEDVHKMQIPENLG